MKSLHTISGKVQKGKQRGKTLGFPTANVALFDQIASGIYISQTTIDNDTFPSLTFIGEAKTFNETHYQSETYILDFAKDIYECTVHIQLVKKIRENEKFISPEVLIKKMKEDEITARKFFSNSNK